MSHDEQDVAPQPDVDAQIKDERMERTEGQRAGALAAIRRLRKDDAFEAAYVNTVPHPYRDDDAACVEIYNDGRFDYWIDPTNDRLVQAGPNSRLREERHVAPNDRLPISELRMAAVDLAELVRPGFKAARPILHPLEDNRNREVYFFRWDDFRAPVKDTELPPFLQVGICADGILASFTDTLRDL